MNSPSEVNVIHKNKEIEEEEKLSLMFYSLDNIQKSKHAVEWYQKYLTLKRVVLLSKLVKAALRAMVDVPSTVVLALDSECIISSIGIPVTRMKPLFHNRISEI